MSRYTLTEYKPFDDVDNFYLMNDTVENKEHIIYIDADVSYFIELENVKFKPKSGLILSHFIEETCYGKDVLDIGTGYSSLLAFHALAHGANNVDAIDADQDVIDHLRKASTTDSPINYIYSNGYQEIKGKKYDVILSNPPQLPHGTGLHEWHDIGGKYGREFVDEIILHAPEYLYNEGELYLLLFGFLGIESKYGGFNSMRELFQNAGLCMSVLGKLTVPIRVGGAMDKSTRLIESIYSGYAFPKIDGILRNEIYVVKGVLSDEFRR